MKNVQMIKTLLSALFCGIFIGVLGIGIAAADEDEDHPLISRYPGASVRHSTVREYDEYPLPVGPLEDGELGEVLHLEGKTTHLQYRVDDRSTLEVYRNYKNALNQEGFEILFEEEGTGFGTANQFVSAVYNPHGLSWKSSGNSLFVRDNFRYLSAKSSSRAGDAYVALFVTEVSNYLIVQVDIIEETEMEADMITVSADYLEDEIARLGFVAIYDVLFVADSAEIKPQSAGALEEIAAFLLDNPDLRFYAVGHTTNIGEHDYLIDLSARRAEAMVDFLVEEYGIAEEVLIPEGVGPLAPIATNETSTGQGLNRRVELVLR